MVLGLFLLAIVLAVAWMSVEAARVRQIRELNSPTPPTAGDHRGTANQISQSAADAGSTNGMVWITGGTFWMGSEDGQPDEQPVHQVTLDGFWIDKTEVSNEQFEKFVHATSYVTVAERKPDPKDFPDAPLETLVPGSIVFSLPNIGGVHRQR